MTFKKLVKILELDKLAPIHYHLPNKEEKEQAIFCKHITDTELDDFFKETINLHAPYDNSVLGVYLPKGTIKDAYEYERIRNNMGVHLIIKNISMHMKVSLSEYDLVFSVYAALHEVGHWKYFCTCGLSNLDYSKKNVTDNGSIKGLKDKANKTGLNYDREIYVKAYNDLPLEKVANEYACAKFLNSYKKVKASI